MSIAIINTRAIIGVQSPAVTVEAHISNGMPGLALVGLPETTVKEARDRVRSALITSGFEFPAKRLTINLAPADLPKEGGRYDLPIALAILAASNQIPIDKLHHYEFLGELALSGELRGVYGAIPAAVAAQRDKRQLILARDNLSEVSLIPDGNSLLAENLLQVCSFLHHAEQLEKPIPPAEQPVNQHVISGDLQEIIGQEHAKRALEISAAGGHNLLFMGPPGTGKTMLASRLTGLLPPLTQNEALETAAIASLVTAEGQKVPWGERPFRSPHHSASMAALVGGGSIPKPGEISLAHNGVLFLDELPEFDRKVLDSLREPLESGEIIISRANAKVSFPAKVQLIAAMNPSPTGHYQGIHNRSHPQQILRYLNRLSGPFLDRFDLSIEVPLLPAGTLRQQQLGGESSLEVRKRVLAAREVQIQRSGKVNAHLNNRDIEKYCKLKSEDAEFLEEVLTRLGLSARAWHRILKVSRTLADLTHSKDIEKPHIAEALSYRSMDRLMLQLHKGL